MKITCENNHEFEVQRLITIKGELRDQFKRPLKCPTCQSTECTRVDEESEGLPNIGGWSATNAENRKQTGHAYE